MNVLFTGGNHDLDYRRVPVDMHSSSAVRDLEAAQIFRR